MKAEYERQAQRRERLSEMGNLAAGVAHEIRNPLNTISIAAQRLAREFKPTANQDQYTAFTGQIRTETGRLNDIITRFLALARDDRRVRAVVEFDNLLYEIGSLLKIEGDGLGIVVTVSSQPGFGWKPTRIDSRRCSSICSTTARRPWPEERELSRYRRSAPASRFGSSLRRWPGHSGGDSGQSVRPVLYVERGRHRSRSFDRAADCDRLRRGNQSGRRVHLRGTIYHNLAGSRVTRPVKNS